MCVYVCVCVCVCMCVCASIGICRGDEWGHQSTAQLVTITRAKDCVHTHTHTHTHSCLVASRLNSLFNYVMLMLTLTKSSTKASYLHSFANTKIFFSQTTRNQQTKHFKLSLTQKASLPPPHQTVVSPSGLTFSGFVLFISLCDCQYHYLLWAGPFLGSQIEWKEVKISR